MQGADCRRFRRLCTNRAHNHDLTRAFIRKHINHLAVTDRRLQAFPKVGVVAVAVQHVKQATLAHIRKQEVREFLGHTSSGSMQRF